MIESIKHYYGLKYSSRKGYKRCECCGKMIENTGNKKMYCDECKKEKTKINWKNASKKYRKKTS